MSFAPHLSRFVGGAPGPFWQRLNAWVHREPWNSIVACLHWVLVLCFVAPIAGMALPWMLAWELLRQFLWDPQTDPLALKRQGDGTVVRLAVVVTGCDSGIGKGLAEALATKGFEVFCGCLSEESLGGFEDREGFHPVLLDVTNDESVGACFAAVGAWLSFEGEKERLPGEKRFLHAVVNNAGIGRAGYLDWLSLSDYEACMNVNYYGIIRMMKAFLPLLKDQALDEGYGHAKIVNLVSIAGILAGGGGFFGSAYEASKAAAEALTNALRLEAAPHGIAVVGVNPSFVRTNLTTNVAEKLTRGVWDKMAPETQEEYGREFFDDFARHTENLMTAGCWDPSVVVESTARAILSQNPPAQLLVGLDARGLAAFSMLPHWCRHLWIRLWIPPQTTARQQRQRAGQGLPPPPGDAPKPKRA